MNVIMLKNILKIIGFILLGLIINLISFIFGTIAIFPYFIIIAIIFSIIFIYKKSRRYLIISLAIYLIILLVTFFPFDSCYASGKGTKYTSCDCNGIIKQSNKIGFPTQCIGKRTACYRYPGLLNDDKLFIEQQIRENNWSEENIYNWSNTKIEIECK